MVRTTRNAVFLAGGPRRQADPTDQEFVKRGGDRKSESIKVSNTDFDKKPGSERNSKPGTLRRLARTRPDLLARIEAGELSPCFCSVRYTAIQA